MKKVVEREKYLDQAPVDWERTQIGELFKFSSGKARPKDISKIRTYQYRYPVYGGNGILAYSKEYSFDNPYLILGRVGEYCGCAHLTEEKSWISDNALYSKDVLSEIDFDYFKFFFDYFDLNRFSNKNGQPLITQGNVGSLTIAKPAPPEQKQIAFVLKTIQKAIQKQEEIANTTIALKKSLLNKLFTEGTKSERLKQTEAGMLPESWGVGLLKEFCEKPTYGFTASSAKTGNAKFLRITDITDVGIDWENVPYCVIDDNKIENYLLVENDIVFARIGATTGKSYIIKNPPENAVYASYLIRVRVNPEHLDPTFLFYFFNSPLYWQQIDANKHNNLKLGVNGSVLQQLLVPKPNPTEQKLIATTFTALDNKIDFHIRNKTTYNNLFNTLLNELMTGTVRVNDLDFHSKTSSYKKVIA